MGKARVAESDGVRQDRVARSLIEDAEEKGLIRPGQTILEPTSGNTGISLAMICGRKGYNLKVVMPDNVTPERTDLLRMYGAEIVYKDVEVRVQSNGGYVPPAPKKTSPGLMDGLQKLLGGK